MQHLEQSVMSHCPFQHLRDNVSPDAGFEAESEEEVTVNPGDEIIVHVEVEGWYQITRIADQTRGLVPAAYVQVTS